MNLRLRLGHTAEDSASQFLRLSVDLVGPVNHLVDVVQVPVGMLGWVVDLYRNGAKSALFHL